MELFRPLLVLVKEFLLLSPWQHILKLHHINCMATPPINVTCSWKEVNTTVGILNVHGFSPYKLSALLLHVQLFYKYQLGGFKPFLIDTVQDFCELSRKDNKLLSLGEFVSRNITGHLINTQCPIEVRWMITRNSLDRNRFYLSTFRDISVWRMPQLLWRRSWTSSQQGTTELILLSWPIQNPSPRSARWAMLGLSGSIKRDDNARGYYSIVQHIPRLTWL